jgi:predicted Zn-dependent peptidase
MLFQGTSSCSAADLANLGNSSSSATGEVTTRDYTLFHGLSPAGEEFPVLDLLGDIVQNPIFPADRLEREKQRAMIEIRSASERPAKRVRDLLHRYCWPSDPIGNPVEGNASWLEAHTRESLICFFHRHYTPNRMIVAAAGAIDHDDFVAHAREVFCRMIGESSPAPGPPPRFRTNLTLENAPAANCYFAIGIEAPPYAFPSRPALEIFAEILGGGAGSRLSRHVRDDRSLAQEIGARYCAYRDAGMLLLEGVAVPENHAEATEAVLSLVTGLATWQEPVSAEELEGAKRHLRARCLAEAGSPEQRVTSLAKDALYFGQPVSVGQYLATIESVERSAMRRLARTLVLESVLRVSVAAVGPNQDRRQTGRLEDLVYGFQLNKLASSVGQMNSALQPEPSVRLD